MSNRSRSRRKFWRNVFLYFAVYAVLIPVVFYLLDTTTFMRLAQKDILLFCLELAGSAFAISLIINFWSRRDPELQKW
ncbi:MAG: hypothetical protein NTW29_18735 [Bacteroidetes bacterium]|nr:hypothetical protein [Bacteroidota bacterium]